MISYEYVCLKIRWFDVRLFVMKQEHVQVVWVGRILVQVITALIWEMSKL